MAAKSAEQDQRARRRKRLIKGLLVGGAAIGIPALANALVSRSMRRLPPPRWGRLRRYAWRHGEIAFQRLGEGPPILLLHSFGPGHGSDEWRTVAETLAAEHQVFAPDLLGWGRSDKPQITYDGELYIQLILDFLHDVVGSPAAVVAAGLTAAYATQIAVDQPDRVRALGLVVPLGIEVHGDEPDVKDAIVHRLLRLPVLGTSALNLFTSRSGISHHLRQDVFAGPERVDAEMVERHYLASHQPGAHASLAAYLAGYLNHGVEELLPRLTVPVWIAWGRQAAAPPIATADLWLRQVDAELEVFEGSGNQPQIEEPAAFARRLTAFLATAGRGEPAGV
jgi:pimeloyl-ACP methyl ester carboxylesterase